MIIEIEATEKQLWAAAQFLKRLDFTDIEKLSASKEETYDAQAVMEAIRAELAKQGYNPR